MPKPIDVNRYEQDFIYSLELPMPNWRWRAKFSGPAISGLDYEALLVESVNGPNGEKLDVDSSFGGGRTTYFPSFPQVDTISVTCYETDTGAANLALGKWGEAVKSPKGFYGLPSHYKGKLLVNMFGYSSNVAPVYSWSFEGIWPSDTGSIELNYTDSGRLTVTTTFSVDRIITGTRAGY